MTLETAGRTPKRIIFLLGFAGLCLLLALGLAWVLGITLFFPDGALARKIVERQDLIRAHIDYLMMSQFLFLFALLLRQYRVTPPLWAIAASCFGAFNNPLAFVLRALKPKVDPSIVPEPHFPLAAGVSFTCITLGFLALVFLVARAAWKARDGALSS